MPVEAITPPVVPPPTDPTQAAIGGTLLRRRPNGETVPLSVARIYLGMIVLDDQGNQAAAGIFEDTSPHVDTNEAGQFLFPNVAPGQYTLFYWTPVGSVMLMDPVSGGDLIFDLKAGDAVNTGVLTYDLPDY